MVNTTPHRAAHQRKGYTMSPVEKVSIPVITSGRQAGPNPWSDAIEEVVAGKGDGQARVHPVAELKGVKDKAKRDKIIASTQRRMRDAAPKDVSVRIQVRGDDFVVWAVDKISRKPKSDPTTA